MSQTEPSARRVKPRSAVVRWRRKINAGEWAQGAVAAIAAWYIRLVFATCRVTFEPANPFIIYRDALPGIGTLWHGNQFLLAKLRPPDVPVRILISNSWDGEITARVAAKFGAGTVRGSGGRSRRWLRKGGVTGFLALRDTLEEGCTVILTADNSRGVPRRAGEGIIALARTTGHGIVGIGIATRPRIVLNSWDRTVLPLPFGRIAVVPTPVVWVPPEADDAAMEAKRQELEDVLNAATDRALAIADRRGG